MFVYNVEPGGIYVVEDAFDEEYWGQGIVPVEQNIRNFFKRYKETGKLESTIITPKECKVIAELIDELNIYEEIIFIKRNNDK